MRGGRCALGADLKRLALVGSSSSKMSDCSNDACVVMFSMMCSMCRQNFAKILFRMLIVQNKLMITKRLPTVCKIWIAFLMHFWRSQWDSMNHTISVIHGCISNFGTIICQFFGEVFQESESSNIEKSSSNFCKIFEILKENCKSRFSKKMGEMNYWVLQKIAKSRKLSR